jgi:hypothetical protein
MPDIPDPLKVDLNQNLWGLILSLASLGSAEYFRLPRLMAFAEVISFVMTISVVFTTFFYTVNYCRKKLEK